MKLYSYWRSSSAWRVRIVLAWKGIPYEYEVVNLAPDAPERVAYFAVNPLRQIPTLEWTEGERIVRLSQSVAIAEYLEEQHPEPRLLPGGALERAWVRQAVEIVNSGVQPLQNSGTLTALGRLTSPEEVSGWATSAMTKGLGALEALAGARGGHFSVGDVPSLADVFLVPQLYNARRFQVDLSPYPRLVAIDAAASALGAFTRAHPDRQPDAPPPKESP